MYYYKNKECKEFLSCIRNDDYIKFSKKINKYLFNHYFLTNNCPYEKLRLRKLIKKDKEKEGYYNVLKLYDFLHLINDKECNDEYEFSNEELFKFLDWFLLHLKFYGKEFYYKGLFVIIHNAYWYLLKDCIYSMRINLKNKDEILNLLNQDNSKTKIHKSKKYHTFLKKYDKEIETIYKSCFDEKNKNFIFIKDFSGKTKKNDDVERFKNFYENYYKSDFFDKL